jgi:Zn-dependent M32 family carboxypeptidase
MSMPKAAQQNSANPADGLALPETFEGGARLLQAQFASAAVIPQAIVEANLSMVSELLMFMSQRVKAQAEFCNSLGHCKELSEAVDAHREFTEKVTRDYSKEVGQLSDIVRKNVASLSEIGAQCSSAWRGKEKLAA